jgi:hypothetical protein
VILAKSVITLPPHVGRNVGIGATTNVSMP